MQLPAIGEMPVETATGDTQLLGQGDNSHLLHTGRTQQLQGTAYPVFPRESFRFSFNQGKPGSDPNIH